MYVFKNQSHTYLLLIAYNEFSLMNSLYMKIIVWIINIFCNNANLPLFFVGANLVWGQFRRVIIPLTGILYLGSKINHIHCSPFHNQVGCGTCSISDEASSIFSEHLSVILAKLIEKSLDFYSLLSGDIQKPKITSDR